MDGAKRTLKGFTVSRRCDICGVRVNVVLDEGDKCIVKCQQCGKEYKFYTKPS